jgi:hypothetical protein
VNLVISLLKKLFNAPKIFGYLFKAAGDGVFGPVVKSIYWKVAGWKTPLGVFFWALYGIAQWMASAPGNCPAGWQCAHIAAYFLTVGTFLVGVGILDAATRQDPPVEVK